MEEFNLDRVEKLFKSNGLKAKENCYFVALKDSRKNQGLIGGANYPYSGLLLEVTEKGIGMFYLKAGAFAVGVGRAFYENSTPDEITKKANDIVKK